MLKYFYQIFAASLFLALFFVQPNLAGEKIMVDPKLTPKNEANKVKINFSLSNF